MNDSILVFVFSPELDSFFPPIFQKRKSSALLDARMAKIYRQQRHSRDEDDSGSDDEDAGLCGFFLRWKLEKS